MTLMESLWSLSEIPRKSPLSGMTWFMGMDMHGIAGYVPPFGLLLRSNQTGTSPDSFLQTLPPQALRRQAERLAQALGHGGGDRRPLRKNSIDSRNVVFDGQNRTLVLGFLN